MRITSQANMSMTVTEVITKKPKVEQQWLAAEVEESRKIEEIVNKQKKFKHRENIVRMTGFLKQF